MRRRIMGWLGAVLLIDGVALLALLLLAVLSVGFSPRVAVSTVDYIFQHTGLLLPVILTGPLVVFINEVLRKAVDTFRPKKGNGSLGDKGVKP